MWLLLLRKKQFSSFAYNLYQTVLMMMIAFITISSSLVPLIEGLCFQIYELIFEIIGGLRSHLLLFFFGRKNMLKKKAVSPRSHPAS